MAHTINVPTRLRHWRVPVHWQMLKTEFATRYVGKIAAEESATEIDGEKYWTKFFDLPQNDGALFDFLNEVGLWQSDPPAAFVHHRDDRYIPIDVGGRFVSSYVLAVDPVHVWRFRSNLRETLPNPKKFIANFAAARKTPSAMRDLLYNQFFVRFELDGPAPAAVVSTVCLREMILAINYSDIARGVRFQICARKDCPRGLFRNEKGDPRKIYCSQYCAHLESMRRSRSPEEKEKK